MGAVLAPVFPVAAVFAAGVVFARRGARAPGSGIGAADSRAFSEFAFRLAIPAYLFTALYDADLGRVFDPRAIGVYAATALALAAVVAAWSRLVWRVPVRGVALRVMAAVQVNTAYFAIPVLVVAFGDATAILPVLLFQVLVLTVVVLAILESGAGPGVATALRRSLTTPLVLACAAGVLCNAARVPVPQVLREALEFVGAAAAPVALFALGLHLGGAGLRWRAAGPGEYALIAVKGIGFPLLVGLTTALAGVPGSWREQLVIVAAMPAPQNLFTFAQAYDTDVDLAAAVVLKSTLLALCLLPLWQLVV